MEGRRRLHAVHGCVSRILVLLWIAPARARMPVRCSRLTTPTPTVVAWIVFHYPEFWTPSDSGIGDLYNLTEVMNVPSVVHTPIIHARAPHTAIVDAVAGYLIGAGGASHSYLMYLLRRTLISIESLRI